MGLYMHRVIGVMTVAAALVGAGTASALPNTGATAPDFAAKSSNGRNIRLRELRGQVVLINFWASWCGPCLQELPQLDKLNSQYRSAGFTFLAVNVDDNRKDAEAMLRRLALRFPTLLDSSKSVARLYGVDSMPATVVIDRDGRVRYVHRGYYSGYERTYEQQIRELLKE